MLNLHRAWWTVAKCWDEPPAGGDITPPATPPKPPPETPPETPPAAQTYTAAEVKELLRGQGKQLKAAETAVAELATLKATQTAAAEADLAKRGEFEELHKKSQTRIAELQADLEAKAVRSAAVEELLKAEVEGIVGGIADAEAKSDLLALVKDRDVLDAKRIASAFAKRLGSAPAPAPSVATGAPGKAQPPGVDVPRFGRDATYRQTLALERLKSS